MSYAIEKRTDRSIPLGTRFSLLDVYEARKRIAPYITRTPLHRYPRLDKMIGAKVYVKHENHQLLGAFKMRGALNVLAQLSDDEKSQGVICASTGNFGQGVAFAAKVFGAQAAVVVPVDANPDKCEAMRDLDARLIYHGRNFDEAREHCERLSREEGYVYVHSANEPRLIPGVGTYSLEIFEDEPDIDVIIVPVGGGSGACGACIVADGLNPAARVIGVQAESAPAAYLSWKSGEIVEAKMETIAEGLATGTGYRMTQEIMRDSMDDFILVSESEMVEAVSLYLETTHNLTEHAGASPLAAALKIKDTLQGQKVALVMSGGNISRAHLVQAMGQS